ncbi:acetolactate synthase large subunit [Streptosporangium sp. NBC_01469]|uniref:acetolactate synthase large subunit n=1 Tax=Streptosporangium sp. NBC_01469 TaxID=2903898 RepID=UPI002E2C6BC8|nr:acetolactate synthase large subunit [Streptosporangium sp. NBC_01469]
MNGARAVLETLTGGGVDVCFTNPGTSEMHFVAALDEVPQMRGVLCLFEGGATGAADGYARMADRPAATLLHLGPGLGNGLANLHNARRAGTPVVNIVGDHATHHKVFDAPLESDIEAAAGTVSRWVRRCVSVRDAGQDTANTIAAAGSTAQATGGVATLILPADVCWSRGACAAPVTPGQTTAVDENVLEEAARLLNREGKHTVVLIGGDLMRRPGLEAASRIAAATGARILAENTPARQERGAGIPLVERLAYLGEKATAQLTGVRHLVLAGARSPVSFFAYPNKPSNLVPTGCAVLDLGGVPMALEELAHLVAPGVRPVTISAQRPGLPNGALTAQKAAAVIGALMPEAAIVSDEAVTSGWWLPQATVGCPPHDWLTLTGGAIGQGIPLATGAAIACPNRPVISLQADGSAMYTLQALWTQARESLNVTTVIFSNASYAILGMELGRVGTRPSTDGRARALLGLPGLDFVSLAEGLGVPASRAITADDLAKQLSRALTEPGPCLIEAVVPSQSSFLD